MTSHTCFAQAVPDTTTKATVVSPNAAAVPVVLKKGQFQPNPKKAGLYSALLPGLGQIYNRQYWKIPIVYAAVGFAGYYLVKNGSDYQSYRKAYIGRIGNSHPTDKYANTYDITQLKQLQDDSKKYLDLTVLLSVVGYTLQVLDAVTSAHLKNFDISRDISMHVTPVITPQGIGFGLAVKF